MVTTIRCPRCGTLSPVGVDFCPNCDTFLPWTDAEVRPLPSAGIDLALSETHVDVVPGAEASVEVSVRNTGRNVDRIDLDVDGAGGGWTVVEPGTLSLMPGAGTVTRLLVRPPRDATVPAGQHVLKVNARSSIEPGADAEQSLSVDVAPFEDLRMRMTPPTSRGTARGVHRVVIENAGNHPVTISLHGRERDGAGEVALDLEPSVVELAAGESAAAVATVSPVRPLREGPARPRPFVVVAQAGPIETVLDGVMIQEPEPAPAPAPAPQPIVERPAPPVVQTPVIARPRRRRRWPKVLAVLVVLAGLAGAAVALLPELRDQLNKVRGAAPAPAAPARRPATPPPPNTKPPAAALPDLSIAAVQCALVPADAKLRFAVQVANRGAPLGDPVTVSAEAGDLKGSTDVAVNGLGTGVFDVPVDDGSLGTAVKFTIAVDPGNAVKEADEGNNAGTITITLPAAADKPVSLCG